MAEKCMDDENKDNSFVSSPSADAFDMKTCEESLPSADQKVDNLPSECSDDEYCDAEGVCDRDIELDNETLEVKHKDLNDEELEVYIHIQFLSCKHFLSF